MHDPDLPIEYLTKLPANVLEELCRHSVLIHAKPGGGFSSATHSQLTLYMPLGRLLHKQGDKTDEMYIVVKGKLMVYQARQIPFGTTATEMRCSIWADLNQLIVKLVIQLGNQKDVAKHLQIKHPHRGVEFMQIIEILDLAIDAANSTTSSTQVTLRHDLEVSDILHACLTFRVPG